MSAQIRGSRKAKSDFASSITVTTPAGTVSGDYMVAFISFDNLPSSLSSNGGGWVEGDEVENSFLQASYTLDLSAGPAANYVWSASSGTANFNGVIVTIDPDGDTFSSFREVSTIATSITSTAGPIDGFGDPAILLCGFGNDGNRTIVTPPAGMILRQHADNISMELAVYTEINPGSGSAQTRVLVWSETAEQLTAHALMLDFVAAPSVAMRAHPVFSRGVRVFPPRIRLVTAETGHIRSDDPNLDTGN